MFMMNKQNVLLEFSEDLEILFSIIEQFFEQSEEMLNKIEGSIENLDGPLLQREAHTMKGIVGYFQDPELREKLLCLETIGKECRLEEAKECFDSICLDLNVLNKELKTLLDNELKMLFRENNEFRK
jgi:HPt (histidine-containing phosphotransfer) domain-containing protein